MKSYIVNLPEKTEIRTLDELNRILEYMIEVENYEMCSEIKKVIDNYDDLLNNSLSLTVGCICSDLH
jgi:hypothetical protein